MAEIESTYLPKNMASGEARRCVTSIFENLSKLVYPLAFQCAAEAVVRELDKPYDAPHADAALQRPNPRFHRTPRPAWRLTQSVGRAAQTKSLLDVLR